MIKETERKEVTVTKQCLFCDVCGVEIRNRNLACSAACCEYCKKDLCEKCIGHEEGTMGDYREVYCKRCWDIGEPYRFSIDKLESEVGELYEKWRSKCKEEEEDGNDR